MATFTMELREVIAQVSEDYTKPEVWAHIGIGDYPIFDENYRESLNRTIIENFYRREIGAETVSLFRFYMGRRMRLLMETYNGLFESQRIEFDPLSTINLKTNSVSSDKASANAETISEQTSKQESKSRAVDHSTPQMALKGDADYASGASDSTGKTDGSGTGKDKSKTESQNNSVGDTLTTGYQGSPASLIMAYRAQLVNVSRMLLTELDDLFMQVWNNDSDYVETDWGYNRVR